MNDGEGGGVVRLLANLWELVILGLLVGGLARAARWARKERMGSRRWSPRVLAWEAVLAVFSGFVGAGLCEAMSLGDKASYAAVALLAYFGPEFIEDLVLRFRDRELPRPPAAPPPADASKE